jgi:hypothetical protein
MSLLQETKEIQSKMALFCRTGSFVELPGLTPNRFHHYRRLVYNIIQENLDSSFPIAHEYIENAKWMDMVKTFFSVHNCQSYQVWQIPGEFYDYAVKHNFSEKYQIDYLNDLLKFEWEEMFVYNMEDVSTEDFNENGDLLSDVIVLNPEHKLLQLDYPVHLNDPKTAVEKKGNYFVLLYREQESGKVQFIDISVWYALVIEQLSLGTIKLIDLLNEAPKLFGDINLEELTTSTVGFLEDLKKRKFVLGFKTKKK